ncbi:MAG: GNAT family N-acetyltransferase [Anaerolineae bacterium]
MPSEQIKVRPARRKDGESIFTWTQNTFSWGDYISDVWYDWLKADEGRLLVAEVEGRVVGNLHVAFLGNREGWMEGMRVHPDYRKLGVATALDQAGQSVARQARCRQVRLETASDNLAAQAAIVTYGYHRLCHLQGYESSALEGEILYMREARPRELGALFDLWTTSWMFGALHGLTVLASGWRWAELTRRRLRDYIAMERVWVTPVEGEPKGFAIVRRMEENLGVGLVVGRASAVRALVRDLRVLAHRSKLDKAHFVFPVSARASALAQTCGLTPREHTMFIYECPLQPGKSRRAA